jgi:hypothetical protein
MVRRADTGSARLVLIAMILANGMILVDQTAVPLALPAIMQGFGVQSQAVQWVLNGSLLPLAGLLVFGGRLGDLLGRRRVFVIGLVVFAGASAVGGLAPSFSLLLVARVAQGIGGALMLPGSVALLSAAFPPEKRGSALGTMGGVAAVAGALGPTIGGVLATVSWRAVLLVNVPLAVACVYLTLRSVGRDAPARERQHVDLSGTVLLCVALVGLVYGLSQTQGSDIGSSQVLLPVAVALLAGVLFVARERRAPEPADELVDVAHPSELSGRDDQPGAGRDGRDGSRRHLPAVVDPESRDDPGLGRSRSGARHPADDRAGPRGRALVRPCGRSRSPGARLRCPRRRRPRPRRRRGDPELSRDPARPAALRHRARAGVDRQRPGEPGLHRRGRPGSGVRRRRDRGAGWRRHRHRGSLRGVPRRLRRPAAPANRSRPAHRPHRRPVRGVAQRHRGRRADRAQPPSSSTRPSPLTSCRPVRPPRWVTPSPSSP